MKSKLFTALLLAASLNAYATELDADGQKLIKRIPAGYRLHSINDKPQIFRGDLNGDGTDDYALVIKRGETEDPVRGIMIFFKDGDDYRLALENIKGLGEESSENCGACGYRSMSFGIAKGNFYIYYQWGKDPQPKEIFAFRYRNSEFELIGYDVDVNNIKGAKSINFPAKKKLEKECPKGKKCKETWTTFIMKEPILLRKIVDFPHFDFDDYKREFAGAGSFTDTRDGNIYWTANIGGNTWMAENLNYKPKMGKSWCYNDTASYLDLTGRQYESYCDKYGRLYDWNTAKAACPAGYHLPSREEWNVLMATIDGKDTDVYGFSSLTGGYRDLKGTFGDTKDYGYWWTAAEYDSGNAYYRARHYWNKDLSGEKRDNKGNGYSVRCIQN
jgi:hypothetical protein